MAPVEIYFDLKHKESLMPKLLPLIRLIKLMRIPKDGRKFLLGLETLFRMGENARRFISFLLFIGLFIHVLACLWILAAV